MSQLSDTPLTDEAERQHAVVAVEFGPMVCSDFARQLERELATANHDIWAYRGALGQPAPGDHNGKLSDGTVPHCGLCDSQYTIRAKEFYDRWLNDSSLETWFPITAEELKKLQAELATAKTRIEKLKDRLQHAEFCMAPCNPCTCGLSKLLEEIKP